MTIVTRFPPSPTGFMHIGNARTALFNWLYARANGGKFLLRIEDTDRARHSEEAVQAIHDGLEWLGLDYDGEAVSQFSRLDRHRKVAEDLLAKGAAYKCFCTPDELEAMREEAKAAGRPTAYNKEWRNRTDHPSDKPYVIRIKAPLDGESVVEDEVQGQVTAKNEQIDDFVLLRADGTPTYMLAVVVDDHDMGVTHVIRGDDHLNNAFRQNVIYNALGWDMPVYAHLPLIHGADGKKFSKRHGAEGVEDYKQAGYLPETLFNFLLKLGWSHGDDEIMSRDQALEWFGLEGIGKAAANFDNAKLENLNAHYMKNADINRLISLTTPEANDTAKARIIAHEAELKDRSKTLLHFAEEAAFYTQSIPLGFDDQAREKIEANKDLLSALHDTLAELSAFDKDAVMAACKLFAKDHADGKLGNVGMPLRAALTGRAQSVGIFEAAAILGQTETCARIKAVL